MNNLITDVLGLRVGNAHDDIARTGATVILPDVAVVCGVDVRGGGPGTRETDALAPENLVETIDAIVLSGGSVYGLAAADGVAAILGSQGKGFGLTDLDGVPKSPVIPSAILYDLANGGAACRRIAHSEFGHLKLPLPILFWVPMVQALAHVQARFAVAWAQPAKPRMTASQLELLSQSTALAASSCQALMHFGLGPLSKMGKLGGNARPPICVSLVMIGAWRKPIQLQGAPIQPSPASPQTLR